MRELILALSAVITVGGSALASPQASGSAAPAAAVSTAPAATPQVRSFDMEGLVPSVLRVVVFKDDDLVALGPDTQVSGRPSATDAARRPTASGTSVTT